MAGDRQGPGDIQPKRIRVAYLSQHVHRTRHSRQITELSAAFHSANKNLRHVIVREYAFRSTDKARTHKGVAGMSGQLEASHSTNDRLHSLALLVQYTPVLGQVLIGLV